MISWIMIIVDDLSIRWMSNIFKEEKSLIQNYYSLEPAGKMPTWIAIDSIRQLTLQLTSKVRAIWWLWIKYFKIDNNCRWSFKMRKWGFWNHRLSTTTLKPATIKIHYACADYITKESHFPLLITPNINSHFSESLLLHSSSFLNPLLFLSLLLD